MAGSTCPTSGSKVYLRRVGVLGQVPLDDDDLMRAGLRAVLSSDEMIEVGGEASDGRAATGASANRTIP